MSLRTLLSLILPALRCFTLAPMSDAGRASRERVLPGRGVSSRKDFRKAPLLIWRFTARPIYCELPLTVEAHGKSICPHRQALTLTSTSAQITTHAAELTARADPGLRITWIPLMSITPFITG